MTAQAPELTAPPKSRGIWSYNLRILLGNSYWLLVTPIAAAQLVLFWNMAMGAASLFSPMRAAQTFELVAPLLGAFLCAHVLAPEQAGVRELVFARPVSLEKILLVRLSAMFAFVLAVLTPAMVVYTIGIHGFPLGRTLLAGLPSMLFLSMLAMAVATGTRNPLLGLAVAAAYWTLDFAVGTQFNPVVTLHGFTDYLDNRPMADQWVLGKLIMLALAGMLYLWNRRLLRRPPGPRRWVTMTQVCAAVLLVLAAYVYSGAAFKLSYGIRNERQLAARSYLWYKQRFQSYGPIPVPRLFGPAFALFVQAKSASRGTAFSWVGSALPTPEELANMSRLLERYPNSIWADNAAFELARAVGRSPAKNAWTISTYGAGNDPPVMDVIQEDLEGGAAALSDFVSRHHDSPFAPLALSQRARMALGLLDFPTAVATYEHLLKGYPASGETCDAGLAMSQLYLREGRWKEAVNAADIASSVATWDIKGEAILAAAQAAEKGGDAAGAKSRYEQAHRAAKEARADANQRRPSPRELSGGQIVLRSDGVMRQCEQALARGLKSFTPAQPAPGVGLTGRIVRNGMGVPGARVALSADPEGRASPFLAAPAAQAVTGADGGYTLSRVQPGVYTNVAVGICQPRGSQALITDRLPLPVRVGSAPLTLPVSNVVRAPKPRPRQQEVQRPTSPTTRAGGRGGQRGGSRGNRGGGQRGGGQRSGDRSGSHGGGGGRRGPSGQGGGER